MSERVLPRQFDTPPELLIPLSNDELRELGTFSAIWSQIDTIMLWLIAHLAKSDMGTVNVLMDGTTTGPRVNKLSRLCSDADPAQVALKTLLSDNGGLIEDRNHIVHGVWAIQWDVTSGETHAACLYQKGKREPIPASKLSELSNRAAKLSNSLGFLLEKINPMFGGDRPRAFFFGAGSPEGREQPPWPPK